MSNNYSMKSSKADNVCGTITVPGDKSMSHRIAMLGGLAQGKTTVKGMLQGEDVKATVNAMSMMGVEFTENADGTIIINGIGGENLKEPDDVIYLGNSGTSARLLCGIVAGNPITVFFSGDKSLSKRPMKRVIDPLRKTGASFVCREGGRLPLAVKGCENPTALEYEMPVASAQVKSAILLAGLNSSGTTVIKEKILTRDHSENMLAMFGVNVKREKERDSECNIITLPGLQMLKAPEQLVTIPADISSAAFPIALAVLAGKSELIVENVGINPLRTGFIEALKLMGADITYQNERISCGEKVADIKVGVTDNLQAIEIDEKVVPSMIDEFPIFSVVASCAKGDTVMKGLGELRVKESDRLAVMAKGLAKCGVSLTVEDEGMIIHGNGQFPQGNAVIDTDLDHRIAMSFLVLGAVSNEPIIINDGTPINTSFPRFADIMNSIGADIERN